MQKQSSLSQHFRSKPSKQRHHKKSTSSIFRKTSKLHLTTRATPHSPQPTSLFHTSSKPVKQHHTAPNSASTLIFQPMSINTINTFNTFNTSTRTLTTFLPQTIAPTHSLFLSSSTKQQHVIKPSHIKTSTAASTPRAITILTQLFSTSTDPDVVDVTYIEPSGEVVPLRVKKSEHKDDSLMTLAVKNQVDMEGSCDGQLACSTCHCILSQEVYDKFMELKPPTDEELDMLDTAFGLTSTSRLGCQIPIGMIDKNITLTLPKFTR